MGSKVHRVRFYNPKPLAINCVAFKKKQKHIAVARSDGSIEIWDINNAPYLVRLIPGVENASVEALGWAGDRLLSTGLNGSLIEWDVVRQKQRTSLVLTGYAAWCLDIDPEEILIAVGTEQGYINLYSLENDEIMYNKLFDKQDGRIMCCKFDRTGKTIVTGSIDCIRVWNVKTGHAITRMSVSRRQKEVIVWCVAILMDNTIVSGDSYGRLTFWDGALGEQIESFPTHKGDILSIAVSEDEQNIYCSGIDPIIAQFMKVQKNEKNQGKGSHWVKHVQRHIHQHDVRALLVNDGKLISVGVDGYLTFSSYPPKWVMRVPPMIPAPRSYVCASKKLLLLRYNNYLEVWKLGSYATSDSGDVVISSSNKNREFQNKRKNEEIEQDSTISEVNKLANNNKNENQRLKLTENPTKLVSIQTKHKKQIQCCALSPGGEFIVYSTGTDMRLLKLDTDEDQTTISLSKVIISGLSSPCDRVAFSDDSKTMVTYGNGELNVLHVDPEAGATVIQTVRNNVLKTSSVIHLLVSKKMSSRTYIVLADSEGVIEVLVEKKKNFVPYVTLPKYQCVPTALTIDPQTESLTVIYADQKIVEYDVANKRVCGWPEGSVAPQWRSRTAAVEGVAVHPRREALVCHDNTSLWILERNAQENEGEPEIKKKVNSAKPKDFSVVPIKYLAGFHWLEDDEAVVLEVLPENIVSQLPAPIQMNRWT